MALFDFMVQELLCILMERSRVSILDSYLLRRTASELLILWLVALCSDYQRSPSRNIQPKFSSIGVSSGIFRFWDCCVSKCTALAAIDIGACERRMQHFSVRVTSPRQVMTASQLIKE